MLRQYSWADASEPAALLCDDVGADNLALFAEQNSIPIVKLQKPKAAKKAFGLLTLKSDKSDDSLATISASLTPSLEPLGPFTQDDTALILFTSGTTSKPKGVELSRKALISQFDVFVRKFELDEKARILNHLPTHHTDGLNQGVVMAFFTGANLVQNRASQFAAP